jgi:hypothetical protein
MGLLFILNIGTSFADSGAGRESAKPPVFPSCKQQANKSSTLHLIGGDGPDACIFKKPPPDFNPFKASSAELLAWGFPPYPERVKDESVLVFNVRIENWNRQVRAIAKPGESHAKGYQCTDTEAEFQGPKEMYIACARKGAVVRPLGGPAYGAIPNHSAIEPLVHGSQLAFNAQMLLSRN